MDKIERIKNYCSYKQELKANASYKLLRERAIYNMIELLLLKIKIQLLKNEG